MLVSGKYIITIKEYFDNYEYNKVIKYINCLDEKDLMLVITAFGNNFSSQLRCDLLNYREISRRKAPCRTTESSFSGGSPSNKENWKLR